MRPPAAQREATVALDSYVEFLRFDPGRPLGRDYPAAADPDYIALIRRDPCAYTRARGGTLDHIDPQRDRPSWLRELESGEVDAAEVSFPRSPVAKAVADFENGAFSVEQHVDYLRTYGWTNLAGASESANGRKGSLKLLAFLYEARWGVPVDSSRRRDGQSVATQRRHDPARVSYQERRRMTRSLRDLRRLRDPEDPMRLEALSRLAARGGRCSVVFWALRSDRRRRVAICAVRIDRQVWPAVWVTLPRNASRLGVDELEAQITQVFERSGYLAEDLRLDLPVDLEIEQDSGALVGT